MSYEIRRRLAGSIRRLRADRGWSQERLAEVSSLHRTYIGAIERCERNISLDNLTRIAIALDTEVATLLACPDPSNDQIREMGAGYHSRLTPFIPSKIPQQSGQINI